MDFEAFQGLWETRVAKRIELMKDMDEDCLLYTSDAADE